MSSSGQRELSEYDDMISNLIRLLRLNITKRPVVTAVIHAISNLCVGKCFKMKDCIPTIYINLSITQK